MLHQTNLHVSVRIRTLTAPIFFSSFLSPPFPHCTPSPNSPSQSSPTLNRPESPAYLTPLGMSDGPRASYLQPEGSLYGMDRRDSSYAGSLSSEAAMGGMGVAGGRNSWGSNLAVSGCDELFRGRKGWMRGWNG